MKSTSRPGFRSSETSRVPHPSPLSPYSSIFGTRLVTTTVPLPPTEIEFRVRYAETDQMGVVYHTNYLIWCEMGRTDFIRARGLSYADIERSGTLLAVSDLTARFLGAARYEDLIRVQTTLTSIQSRSIVFDYLITHAETHSRLVTASTTLISVDSTGRPKTIPPDVRRLFSAE